MNLNNIPVKGARALMLGITFKEIYPVKLQTSYFIENYPKNCESHFYEEYPSKCSAYFTGDCPDTSEAKSRTRFGIRNTKAIGIYPVKSRREFKRDLTRRSKARIRNHLQNNTGAISYAELRFPSLEGLGVGLSKDGLATGTNHKL